MQLLRPRERTYLTDAKDVLVAASPVVRENLSQFGDVARIAKWTEMHKSASEINELWTGTLSLVPLPAFQIQIINRTGQSFSLAQSPIEVEDSTRRKYGFLMDAVAIKGRFIADIQGLNTFMANDRQLMDWLLHEIHKIQLVEPSVVVAAGQTWTGYLILNTDAHNPAEYRALMKSIDGFAIRFGNVPSESGKKDVVISIEKFLRPLEVTCPWDLKQPSFEDCTPFDAKKVAANTTASP